MYQAKHKQPNNKKRTRILALFISLLVLLGSVIPLFNYLMICISAEGSAYITQEGDYISPYTESAVASSDVNAVADNKKLQNGSFEEGQSWSDSYKQLNQSSVPYWNTTAFQGKIELFRENTGVYIPNVKLSPTDGSYAAELNADEESALYQNVKTTPSSVYEWGIDHGARNGTDTMALVIGPKQNVAPSKPSKEGRDQLMQMVDWLIEQGKTSFKTEAGLGEHLIVYSKKFASGGTFEDNANNKAFSLVPSTIYTEEWHIWIMASCRATEGTNPWTSYGSNAEGSAAGGESGDMELDFNKYYLYNVPEGQTETLFGFVSVGYIDSIGKPGKEKTYGNFLDNINFVIYHPITGSTTTHGNGIVSKSDGTTEGSGNSEGHEVTTNNDLKTYVIDGQPLKIQAIIKKEDVDSGCEFIGLYYSMLDAEGNPETIFFQLSGNVIDYDDDLTDEQKKGKWIRSTNTEGDIIFTYYIESITSPADLHFVFGKSPTITYDPNGGKDYIVERIHNTDEAANVYSYKPVTEQSETLPESPTIFIDPYVSHIAEGKNDGWKFMGWLLTGDNIEDTEGHELVNSDKLGSLLLPAVHTAACDYSYSFAGVNGSQYFKIYEGDVSLTQTINTSAFGENLGVTWTNSDEEVVYANIHDCLTMVAQWRWRQAFIPQVVSDNTYDDSETGGTVEITSSNPTDENYNAEYTDKGGKSYHAATGEIVTAKATANTGYTFVGWYDTGGNLITPNATLSYTETKESVNTYYARFSDNITQTYIRQVKNGDSWDYTEDDSIGTLDRYTYTDVAGMPISSTATAGTGYKFVGWYDSEGNKVADSMLTGGGVTLSYTTEGNATYYARFLTTVTQTYIRQINNGGTWENTADDNVGTLDRYTHIDEAGMPVSSRATAGTGYRFVGWYYSEGNKVADSMLTGGGATLSYTTTGNATYYARFESLYTLNVGKIDGNKSIEENNVPIAGAEFTLYQKDDSGDKTVVYEGESITCTAVYSNITVLSEDGTEATAVFTNMLFPEKEYYLAETKAPAGYSLLDTPLKITIDSSGNNALIDEISKDINEKEVNVELANYLTLHMPTSGIKFTGGWFTVMGLTLLTVAELGLFGFKISRFKRKK